MTLIRRIDFTHVPEQLRAAKALIERPAQWSGQGWGDGKRRCAARAVKEARGGCEWPNPYVECIKTLQVACGGYVGVYNDTHNHAEVMEWFDRAIALSEESA